MEWLDRALITGPNYCLCLSEEEYKQALEYLKVTDYKYEWLINNCDATHHWFTNDGDIACVVCLRDIESDIEVIYALIAHEAMHIWQTFKADIGEECPSKEFEAYSVQALCQRLFYAYKKQSKVKRNVTPKNRRQISKQQKTR